MMHIPMTLPIPKITEDNLIELESEEGILYIFDAKGKNDNVTACHDEETGMHIHLGSKDSEPTYPRHIISLN